MLAAMLLTLTLIKGIISLQTYDMCFSSGRNVTTAADLIIKAPTGFTSYRTTFLDFDQDVSAKSMLIGWRLVQPKDEIQLFAEIYNVPHVPGMDLGFDTDDGGRELSDYLIKRTDKDDKPKHGCITCTTDTCYVDQP